jgi:hypothetical protein
MRSASAVVLTCLAFPLEAAAEPEPPASPPPPDPAALAAGDANLETTSRRRGRNFTLAGGGGLTIGFGIEDAVGNGGAVSFRLGHSATPRTVLTAELATVVLLHRVAATEESELRRNEDVNLLLGAQFYPNRTLWLRTAFGLGVFNARNISDGMGGVRDVRLPGPAALVGAGLDLLRAGRISAGVELMSIAMINREGLLSTGGFLFNITVE